MRCKLPILLSFALVGCVSTRHSFGELLAPDQFHLGYTQGGYDSAGSLRSGQDPWGFRSTQEGDFDAWFVGLSWNLTGSPRNPELERLMRYLVDASLARSVEPAVPVAAPIIMQMPESPAAPASPDINITVKGGDQSVSNTAPPIVPVGAGSLPAPKSKEPAGVLLLGISSEVWTQLIIALSLLAGAVAAYLKRHQIPILKKMTAKGKAKSSAK